MEKLAPPLPEIEPEEQTLFDELGGLVPAERRQSTTESAAVLSKVGPPDTGSSLFQCCAELNSVQKQLLNVLREVAHPDCGVVARTKSANDSLQRSMAIRAQQIEGFLARLEKQIWATWLPVVATAALALGFVLGTWFANARQAPSETTNAAQLQQAPMAVAPGEHKKEH